MVRDFAEAGYLAREKDEYRPVHGRYENFAHLEDPPSQPGQSERSHFDEILPSV
jgi:hypothetical protein